MHVIVVVGARPNFVKIAPVMEAFKKRHGLSVTLVHTGQHYDDAMSSAFFKDLAMPEPDIYLGVGSGGHGEQTGKVLAALEDVLSKKSADIVMVAGAVNSTVACALAAAKCQIPVAHVEAGLCSFDRTMPEEINRVVTDALADYLFTPSVDADWNLIREGVPKKRIYRVGNVMIDTLRRYEHDARARKTSQNFNLQPGGYAVCTLHRPSNVDSEQELRGVVRILEGLQDQCDVVFPIHPRMRKKLDEFGLVPSLHRLTCLHPIEPLGYLDFLGLLIGAVLVLTDSGGVQEETTALGVPCLTMREHTERPVTVTQGTNVVVGTDPKVILRDAGRALAGDWPRGAIPEGWDGCAAERIAQIMSTQTPTLAPHEKGYEHVTALDSAIVLKGRMRDQ
jgi:UDP-N-acetylglucosamine 2-epimerase (non-hydrolysing)